MRHPEASGALHRPFASLQVSVVQLRPSLHAENVGHVACAVQRPQPGTEPSSQRTPVRAVHAVVLLADVQTWHEFAALSAPSA